MRSRPAEMVQAIVLVFCLPVYIVLTLPRRPVLNAYLDPRIRGTQ